MIIVKGRELLIPENERYLGTNYDTGMENRVFRIPRLSQSGTDLSDLTFKVNLIFNSEPLDVAELQKNVDDDYIYLTWTVTAAQVAVTGTVFVCVTGNDTNDTVKWSSFMAPFYTEKSLGEDVESAYKKIVKKVDKEIEDRKAMDAAEREARETADNNEKDEREAADENILESLSEEKTSREASDASLGERIAALGNMVGSPFVANTVSAMTDHSKVYVYTGSESGYTSGHWYYWNGSAWTDGGVYQSSGINTDTELVTWGVAADAKAAGNGIKLLAQGYENIFFDRIKNSYPRNDGGFNTYNNWDRTSLIPVEPNEIIYINVLSNTNNNVWYKADQTPIASGMQLALTTGLNTVRVPSTAYYLCLSASASNWFSSVYRTVTGLATVEKIYEEKTLSPLEIADAYKSDDRANALRKAVTHLWLEFESPQLEAEFWAGTHTVNGTAYPRSLGIALVEAYHVLSFYWFNQSGNYILGASAFSLRYVDLTLSYDGKIAMYDKPVTLDGYNITVHAVIDYTALPSAGAALSLRYTNEYAYNHRKLYESINKNEAPLKVGNSADGADNALLFANNVHAMYFEFASNEAEQEFWSGTHTSGSNTYDRNIGLCLIGSTEGLMFYWLNSAGSFADRAFTINSDDAIQKVSGLTLLKKAVTLDGYAVTVKILINMDALESATVNTAFVARYDKTTREYYKTLFAMVDSGTSSNYSSINFGVDGDSITENLQWSYYAALKLGYATRHNVAIGSSQWCDKLVDYNGTTYYPQIYGTEGFLGMSNGWGEITSAEEAQKRANNCGKNHLLKFIYEVDQGLYPAPDVFVFAFGTNDDSERIGTVSAALAPVSRPDVDDPLLRTTTGAMRWCVQKLHETYPGCKILWSVPIQSATDSRQNSNLIKIPVMREMAEALSVQIIDQWHDSGICAVLEKATPYYLADGTHPTVKGQKAMAECACAVLGTLKFID